MGKSILDQLAALRALEKQKIESRRARKAASSVNSTSSRRKSTTQKKRVSVKGAGASVSSQASAMTNSQSSIQLPAETDLSEVSSVASGLSEQSGRSRARSEISVSNVDPEFRQTMMVDSTWEDLKAKMPDYEDQVGEEIVMQMMELDPQARKEMGITTLRSDRFKEMCKILVSIVDVIVCLVGPDMVDEFEEELKRIGRQCQEEGIRVDALGTSISKAIHLVSGEKLSESEQEAWKIVFDHVSWKMAPSTS